MPVLPLFQLYEPVGVRVNDDLAELARYVASTRKLKKLTLTELAKRGGPSVGWTSMLESGQMLDMPKVATLKRLALALGVLPSELFKIVGYQDHALESASGQIHGNHAAAMVSGVVSSVESGQNHGREPIIGESSVLSEGISGPGEQLQVLGDADWLLLPVLGAAACGEPIYAIMEHATETTKVLRKHAEALGANAAFIIRGDSMSGMMLNDGDSVLVRMLDGERPANGKVVIVRTPDGLVAKQYKCDEVGEYLQEHELGQEPRRVRFDEGSLVAVVVFHYRAM